jgi:acetolactate synthase-1/2/3 large subunit
VPVDVLATEEGSLRALPHPSAPTAPAPEDVRAAAALLAGASAPVVLAGGGALGAAADLQRVAELLDAPVVTTGNGKGALPTGHRLAVGALLPFAPVLELLAGADAVLVVGSELSEVDLLATGARLELGGDLVRIDVDPAQHAFPPPRPGQQRAGLVADAAQSLRALAAALEPAGRAGQRSPRDGASRARAARDAVDLGALAASHAPWLAALEAAVTDEVTVVLDSTQLAYTALHALPASRPGQFLAPYGLGTLGNALPMAVGAHLGRQRLGHGAAPVLAVAGDGGVLFTLPELATAVDVGGPLVLVVWDNAGYAEIRDSFDRVGAERTGTETTAHDLAAIAAGFGARATLAPSPAALADAVASGLRADRPTVVVVPEPGSPAALR